MCHFLPCPCPLDVIRVIPTHRPKQANLGVFEHDLNPRRARRNIERKIDDVALEFLSRVVRHLR
jgi:hypothetical protein